MTEVIITEVSNGTLTIEDVGPPTQVAVSETPANVLVTDDEVVVQTTTLTPANVTISEMSFPLTIGEDASTIIEVHADGPQGPPGPSGDKHYTHTQGSASSTWTITHNLGKMPSVVVVDSADNYVVGEVHYDSLNQVTVTFGSAFAGKAYLN